jgi:hypothetical protein
MKNTCRVCGAPVTVWADRSGGVTVNFRCPTPTCTAGKGPWDTPEPLDDDKFMERWDARRDANRDYEEGEQL